MSILQNIIGILSAQINRTDVKLPKKVEDFPIIQDINMSINNGAINEKFTSSLRSKSPTRTKRR
jgi:hypothetical protein